MEKYLLQILESNNRVIVPEFGAFIIKQKTPLTIIFNEFLQYNDGMLVDAISKKEGVDRDSAKKKIDEFIATLNSALENEGRYNLPGIGMVTKGASGKISLEKEESKKAGIKEQKAAATKEKKSVQNMEKEKAAPKKVSESKEETIEIVAEEKPKEKNKKEEKPKIAEEKPKTDEEKPKEEKTEVHATIEHRPQPEKKTEEKSLDKQTYRTSPSYSTSSVYSNKKGSRTKLIVWLIIIVIINGALIGYFFYSEELSALFTRKTDEMMQVEPVQEDQLQPEIEQPEEVFEDMTIEDTEEKPVESVESPEPVITNGSRYYIVAGVFSNENNADNLVIELRQKGYKSEKFGKIGNLHAVSYNVFYSKADADRELRKIQNEADPEAWIKEVK